MKKLVSILLLFLGLAVGCDFDPYDPWDVVDFHKYKGDYESWTPNLPNYDVDDSFAGKDSVGIWTVEGDTIKRYVWLNAISPDTVVRTTSFQVVRPNTSIFVYYTTDTLKIGRHDTILVSSTPSYVPPSNLDYDDGYYSSQEYRDWLIHVIDSVKNLHYDTVTVDGYFRLTYNYGRELVKEVRFHKGEQVEIDSCGFDVVGGRLAWSGYVDGKFTILYPGKILVPDQNLVLSFYKQDGIEPEGLENFFLKARDVHESSVHNLSIYNISESDFDYIRTQISENEDFYLNLTLQGASSVTDIVRYALSPSGHWNNSVRYIKLDKNFRDIESNGFANLKSLTEVYIDCDVRTIYEDAFYGCSSLRKLTLNCKPPVLKSKNCF